MHKLDKSWSESFTTRDLRRGERYFEGGFVRRLTKTSDGWEATVFGSQAYNVFVPGDPSSFNEMSCDCPRFASGYYCKHLAAVCMAIEGDEPALSTPSTGQSLGELVRSVPEQEVRAFLLEALEQNKILATSFRQQYGVVDAQATREALKAQIEDAVWDYSQSGFINWRASSAFESRYNEIVSATIEPLIARRAFDAAFEACIQVLVCLQDIQIDDSNGFTTSVIDDVRDYWKRMLKRGGGGFTARLFDGIERFLSKPPKGNRRDMFEYEAEMAERFLIDAFSGRADVADHMLDLADKRIRWAEQDYGNASRELERVRKEMGEPNAPLRGGYGGSVTGKVFMLNQKANTYFYRMRDARATRAKWTLVRLQALAALGASESEMLQSAGDLVYNDAICHFFYDRAIERGDTESALKLLKGCKAASIEQGSGSYPIWVSQALVEKLTDVDVEGVREELTYLIQQTRSVDARTQTDELWSKLRSTYACDEWLAVRDEWLGRLTNARVRRDCLAAEGLYDRLMEEVGQEGLYDLSRYEEVLVEHYPARVLNLYLEDLKHGRLYPGKDRKGYQAFAERLRHIKELPGGEEPVRKIIDDMRKAYPRRTALMDELSRV